MVQVIIRKVVGNNRAGEYTEYLAREYDSENPPEVDDASREYGRFDTLEEAVMAVNETFQGQEFIMRLDI